MSKKTVDLYIIIRYVLFFGAEVETEEKREDGKKGLAHNLCYFPKLEDIKNFSKEMSTHIKNITLSTQRANLSGYDLIDIVEKYNGYLVPAHVFTPFKSYYGNCTKRLERIFKEKYDAATKRFIHFKVDIKVFPFNRNHIIHFIYNLCHFFINLFFHFILRFSLALIFIDNNIIYLV